MLLAVDLLLVGFLLLVIYAIFMALAAMAAGIDTWPLFACLALIFFIGCIGCVVSRKHRSQILRRFGFAIHGTALSLALVVTICIGWSWLHMFRRRFLLVNGYQGDVYVLHSATGGTRPEKSWWRTTYQVPANGILVTTDPPLSAGQGFSDEYDYVESNGHLKELEDVGPGTLPDTPENGRDNSRVYSYFPRTGSGSTTDGCSFESDEITIGTKAFILSQRKGNDMNAFLAQHPEVCLKPK